MAKSNKRRISVDFLGVGCPSVTSFPPNVTGRWLQVALLTAGGCLRDGYVRGKCRDVILPMVVLRRLDALLEPAEDAVAEEINDETYAIYKSGMMIEGNSPEHIKSGSTLSTDEFADKRFELMLSSSPYGKSWASEITFIEEGKDVVYERFRVRLTDY